MRLVIQRVKASVLRIDEAVFSEIKQGLLIFVGIEDSDNQEDIAWLSKKVANLRIFDDDKGVMNLSVKDISGEIMLVSQFTLHASTKKGNRPSYIKAAKPDVAVPVYKDFISRLEKESNINIKTGKFGADMQISLINDGPVTIIIDSKHKE